MLLHESEFNTVTPNMARIF